MSSQTLNHVFQQAESLSVAEQMELIARLAQRLQTRIEPPQQDKRRALQQAYGIWQHGDGLAYQQKLRAEWDER